MLGPLVLNTLALARWVGQSAGSPQYYPRYNSTESRYIYIIGKTVSMKCSLSTCLSGDRPSYRDQAVDYPSSRSGDYRMYGALAGPGDTAAFYEPGSRGRAGYYGARDYRGQEVGLEAAFRAVNGTFTMLSESKVNN